MPIQEWWQIGARPGTVLGGLLTDVRTPPCIRLPLGAPHKTINLMCQLLPSRLRGCPPARHRASTLQLFLHPATRLKKGTASTL